MPLSPRVPTCLPAHLPRTSCFFMAAVSQHGEAVYGNEGSLEKGETPNVQKWKQRGSGWCELWVAWKPEAWSLKPRELWKVVQARNNRAYSQGVGARAAFGPCCAGHSPVLKVSRYVCPGPFRSRSYSKGPQSTKRRCGPHECFYLPDPLIAFAFYFHKTLQVC